MKITQDTPGFAPVTVTFESLADCAIVAAALNLGAHPVYQSKVEPKLREMFGDAVQRNAQGKRRPDLDLMDALSKQVVAYRCLL